MMICRSRLMSRQITSKERLSKLPTKERLLPSCRLNQRSRDRRSLLLDLLCELTFIKNVFTASQRRFLRDYAGCSAAADLQQSAAWKAPLLVTPCSITAPLTRGRISPAGCQRK